MAQRRFLLDTNSYFRLAKSIHPLLGTNFGPDPCCLFVLKELDKEFEKNVRLQNKFSWVGEAEYKTDRAAQISLSRDEQKDVQIAIGFIRNHSNQRLLGLSRIDIQVLAVGYVLAVVVVTDDDAMLDVSEVFGIKAMKSLDVLKLMRDVGHIDMAKVRQTVSYWDYERDKPKNCDDDFLRLFNEAPP